ncbi:hypothetical protein JJV70_02165 [Streptomyces sp. JJ66]|uniref:hypothetical protein n=1 Tax=Streptomyces sp. JJ66 TaxID=2803843 RepID=UPI001C56249B|nr:hypothetical protein [Streptomyces sp. JJ66]MBW1600925.1 hypothetical protein [Streptomyces sp. JJ66]
MQTHIRAIPPWAPPPGPTIEYQRAGVWWDAVRVPAALAPAVFDALDGRSGAVIEDTPGRLLTWFVQPGATAGWPRLDRVGVLGRDGIAIPVPPAGCRWGELRWLVLPGSEGPWTDAAVLEQALTVGVAQRVGPRRPVTVLCTGCGRPTGEAVLVATAPAAFGPDHGAWACRACAPHLPDGPGAAGVVR